MEAAAASGTDHRGRLWWMYLGAMALLTSAYAVGQLSDTQWLKSGLVFNVIGGETILALIVERVLMRPLHGSTLNTMIVVTLGMFLLLYGLTGTIWNQSITRNLPAWFAADQVDILNVNLTYEQLITLGCAVLVAAALWFLFRHTRIGVSMRAVVDDPALASMTGARSGRIAGLAWIIGFMAAGPGSWWPPEPA